MSGTPSKTGCFDLYWTWATDLLLLLAVILAALPDGTLPNLPVGGIQHAMLPYTAAAALIAAQGLATLRHRSGWILLFVICGLWMTAMALNNLDEPLENKSLGGDLIIYSGLIVGLAWGELRDTRTILRRLRLASVFTLVLALFTLRGLTNGSIESLGTGDRLLVFAVFWDSWFLTSIFPLLFNTADEHASPRTGAWQRWLWRGVAVAGILTVFLIGFLSSTRSVMIGGCAAVLLMILPHYRRRGWALQLSLVLVAGLTLVLAGSLFTEGLKTTDLGQRMFDTTLRDEGRFSELEELMGEFKSSYDWLLGKGFGSTFFTYTTGEVSGGTVVLSPHIGLSTLLLKGGILTLAICLLWPALKSIRIMWHHPNAVCQSAASGSILYFILSSMSGGWDFKMLFLLGIFFSLAFNSQHAVASIPRSSEPDMGLEEELTEASVASSAQGEQP